MQKIETLVDTLVDEVKTKYVIGYTEHTKEEYEEHIRDSEFVERYSSGKGERPRFSVLTEVVRIKRKSEHLEK